MNELRLKRKKSRMLSRKAEAGRNALPINMPRDLAKREDEIEAERKPVKRETRLIKKSRSYFWFSLLASYYNPRV